MSDPTLATYSFLSFVRRGAAAKLVAVDSLQGPVAYRGALAVQLSVESRGADGSTTADTISNRVLLYGPGDVVGIDPRHVIRSDPRNLATDFEPNYLASIEFEHPDFPWLFTPASADAAGTRLRPWLVLVVLAEDEFDRPSVPPHPLPRIHLADTGALPPLEDSWAWAHAQVAGGTDDLAETIRTEPGRVISRLLSTRRLRPRTRYHAFLVPAFTDGVLAGRGETVPSGPNLQTEPAWKAGDADLVLPVYHEFEFSTSESGDFESLARQLRPRMLPDTVGVRPMAVPAQPYWDVPATSKDLGLAGALRTLSAQDTPFIDPPFQTKLAAAVNRGAAPVNDTTEDPRITPPLYGRWHLARNSMDPAASGWLNELNADPRSRSMAGFGAQVVQHERAQLLAAAWRQLGSILAANAKLRAAQLARAASTKVHAKHLLSVDDDDLLAVTSLLHGRLRASPQTIATTIARSRVPARALSASFRRVVRPRGPLRRRQGPGAQRSRRWITGLNSGALHVVPPPHPPGGLTSIEDVSDALWPSWAPDWLRPLLPRAAFWILIVALLVVLLILAIGLLANALPAAIVLALAVIAFAYVIIARLRPLIAQWRSASIGRLDHLTLQVLVDEPPRPNFALIAPGQPPPVDDRPVPGGTDSADGRQLRSALVGLASAFARVRPDPPDADPVELPLLRERILDGLRPEKTVAARVQATIDLAPVLNWKPADELEPVMAAPVIDAPMYEPLRNLSQDFLLPGLKDVPANTVALVQENHAFIEAYLLGANVEFGRVLLYEDFPTDQRPSSFRQFWDVRGYVPTPTDPTDDDALRERLRDIPPIHRWDGLNHLGANRNRADVIPGRLVLLVRGQLLQRYPNAIVYATAARWDPVKSERALGSTEKHPLFRGTLTPDVTFFGFDLTEDEARGSLDRSQPQGWWFVFQQQPSEPRFGLEPPPEIYAAATVTEWNDLSWANFAADRQALEGMEHLSVMKAPTNLQLTAGTDNPDDTQNHWYDGHTRTDAAQVAYITLRRPARVAIHAEMMLPPTQAGA